MAVTIARTPWIDDDGTGTTGTVLNNAIKTELYNQIDGALAQVPAGAAMGYWQAVPFNAADYFAQGGGTWTVGAPAVVHSRYTLIGKTMIWSMYLSWFSGANVVAGTVSAACIQFPATLSPGSAFIFHRQYGVVGGVNGDVEIGNSGAALSITPSAGGNVAAGPLGLITTITCEVN